MILSCSGYLGADCLAHSLHTWCKNRGPIRQHVEHCLIVHSGLQFEWRGEDAVRGLERDLRPVWRNGHSELRCAGGVPRSRWQGIHGNSLGFFCFNFRLRRLYLRSFGFFRRKSCVQMRECTLVTFCTLTSLVKYEVANRHHYCPCRIVPLCFCNM